MKRAIFEGHAALSLSRFFCVLLTGWLSLVFSFSPRAFLAKNLKNRWQSSWASLQRMTEEAITELDQEFFSINSVTNSLTEAIEVVRSSR